MRNNNRSIVGKITRQALRADGRRNFFVVAAIALTAFMITSVFSVGISYYETLMLTPFRSEGVYGHAFLTNQSPEKVEIINSLNYVKRVTSTYRVGMGYIENFESGMLIAAVDEESWQYTLTPVYSAIVGKVAKAENEIMLSRAHLELIGIEKPYIGMEIPMDFVIGDFATDDFSEESFSETFILSAIYTEYVSRGPGKAFTPAFVSEAFAEKYGMLHYRNADFRVLFTNQSRVMEYTNWLAQDLDIVFGNDVAAHPAFTEQADSGSFNIYIAIGIFIIFFSFVGFLLIYNVMYLSVSKDVRFFGLLKAIGTTPRQLRLIVNGQVFRMYAAGMPLGLIAAALSSFAIVPVVITGSVEMIVSFSPLIFVGGAVFTLVTAYIGASVPARKAAAISPVEAVRYVSEQRLDLSRGRKASGWIKPARLAWRNIFRERKRAVIVLLSLFLGVTVFIVMMSLANSMDVDSELAYWFDYDIKIASTNTEMTTLGVAGMDRDFIEEVAVLPGVSEVSEITAGSAFFEYPQEILDMHNESFGFSNPFLQITGIDSDYLVKINKKLENPIDIEAFERGELILIDESGKYSIGGLLYEYFPVGSELYFEVGREERIPVTSKIAGYYEIPNTTWYEITLKTNGLYVIMSNVFLDSIGARAGVNHLRVDTKTAMDEFTGTAVATMANERGLPVATAYEARREALEGKFAVYVLGASVAGILALIGLFNFVNLISVGLLSRRIEFAVYESVGMSRRQMRLMLRWEGAFYWILTLLSSVTLGTGAAYGLFVLIQSVNQFPVFVYPFVPVLVVFCLIVLICTATPELCYRNISKASLVERLREAE